LLDTKGVDVTLIDVLADPSRRKEMAQRSGKTSTPQIFIDGAAIGGCDDLHALDRAGKLDPLLGKAA
jgi:glutaredoxin 3